MIPVSPMSSTHDPLGAFEALNAKIFALLQGLDEAVAMEGVACALQEFSQRKLQECLSCIVESPTALADLARNAYVHGNGFYKIPVTRSASHTLRVHVWRSQASAEENLHSHRWPFASAIVLGSLNSQVWVDAVGDDARTFPEVIYRGKEENFEPVGECRVRLKETLRQAAGDYYWMRADELHRIVSVGDELVMTLMMRPRDTRSWARNILLNDSIPKAKPMYLSAPDLRAVLEEALDALAAVARSRPC